jgi:acyl-CoA thioesterase
VTDHEQELISLEGLSQDIANFGIARLLGMQITTSESGIGRVGIHIDERLMHPLQIVHGGVIFTLADSAMSMPLISVLPAGTRFGTLEAKINFMLPAFKGELLAEGKIIHKGRSTAVLEATVFNIVDGEQHAIARVLGTFNIARSKSD